MAVLAFVEDMIFRSKVQSIASQLGFPLKLADSSLGCSTHEPCRVVGVLIS